MTQDHILKNKTTLLLFFLIVCFNVTIDQITKYHAEKNLMAWTHETDLKDYSSKRMPVADFGTYSYKDDPEQKFFLSFAFNYVRNQGAAWGFLSDLEDNIRIPFFYVVTILALIMIFFYIKSTPANHVLVKYALVVILSGAIGNLLDRIFLGYVIDFIDVRWVIPLPFFDASFRYNFPNFNWADSCISVGVGCLIFDMLFLEAKRNKKKLCENHTSGLCQFSKNQVENKT